VLPYFKRSENNWRGENKYHGGDGPLRVRLSTASHLMYEPHAAAAKAAGIPESEDIHGDQQEGMTRAELTVNGFSRRHSTARAFLMPALRRKNLTLVTHALTTRVRVDNGRAVGVDYVKGGNKHSVTADREVILSGGAYNSPQLLMLSGVGPASHLREVEIDVALDLPGVGANLHDHPVVDLVYRPARPIPAAGNNHGELLGLFCSEKADTAPDLQVLFIDSIGGNLLGTDGMTDGYTLAVAVMQPFSRGTLRLSGPTAGDPLVTDPNYFGDERDMQTMVTGVRLARRIGEAAALNDWRAEEFAPGLAVEDDEALRGFTKSRFRSYWHPVGTCAIGDAPTSVVDSRLRVHGISGLRVADASVIPSIPSGPTAATVYAVAERAADLIASR